MDRIEKTLTDCIDEIRSGRSTVDECLDRYPSQRHELEPLLRLATGFPGQSSVELGSEYKRTAKERLLRDIANRRQERKGRAFGAFVPRRSASIAWARAASIALAVTVVLAMLAGGTAFAARNSLPGEILYPVKIGTESFRLLVADGGPAKSLLNLEFASQRLRELSGVVDSDESKANMAVDGYERNLAAAVRRLRDSSVPVSLSFLENVLSEEHSQVMTCDRLIDSEPEHRGPLFRASDLAVKGQAETIEVVAGLALNRAAEMNVNAMEDRLRRAQATAANGNYPAMDSALLQYQLLSQLAQQILRGAEIGNNTAMIEAYVLQALAGHVRDLSSLAKEIPHEYAGMVDASLQSAIRLQERAQQGQQRPGGSGGGGAGGDGAGGGTTSGQDTPAVGETDPGAGQTGGDSQAPATPSPTDGGGNGGSDNSTAPGNGAGTGGGDGGGQSPTTGGPTKGQK